MPHPRRRFLTDEEAAPPMPRLRASPAPSRPPPFHAPVAHPTEGTVSTQCSCRFRTGADLFSSWPRRLASSSEDIDPRPPPVDANRWHLRHRRLECSADSLRSFEKSTYRGPAAAVIQRAHTQGGTGRRTAPHAARVPASLMDVSSNSQDPVALAPEFPLLPQRHRRIFDCGACHLGTAVATEIRLG